MADGSFFDEKQMLDLGWPLNVVVALRRVFESDAANLQAEIDNLALIKANKISPAVVDNLVSQLADGDIKDTGIASSQVTTNATDITNLQLVVTNKVDKVSGATLGNFATLLANGNIQDSGASIADLTPQQGTGSPEAVVTANINGTYFDTAAASGSNYYFNPVPGATTGWVLV